MTPDERKMLSDLADKFAQTPAPPKDPEAEDFIRTRIGNRPDALYMMTQTVLVQNLALQQAQQQIQALQRGGASTGSSSGSFLGQGGSQSGPSFSQSSGQGQYSAPPQYAQQASTPSPSPGSAPSFLRGAAQTAAGVAAGALAFEGIRSLFRIPVTVLRMPAWAVLAAVTVLAVARRWMKRSSIIITTILEGAVVIPAAVSICKITGTTSPIAVS
jgi:hypothetical protein